MKADEGESEDIVLGSWAGIGQGNFQDQCDGTPCLIRL